ncbi:hypothetical protein BZG36_01898 [Bifiguratus adelaidae]|uniref:DUF747-domain-containing protein n=1 Tax=Bifiguratus adelaidae TaxID=1938954 RepID=A0A261Y4I1_9FUNG|nr:hypothetical protein BZG36_01898 [Bifiguratus adelaidae]
MFAVLKAKLRSFSRLQLLYATASVLSFISLGLLIGIAASVYAFLRGGGSALGAADTYQEAWTWPGSYIFMFIPTCCALMFSLVQAFDISPFYKAWTPTYHLLTTTTLFIIAFFIAGLTPTVDTYAMTTDNSSFAGCQWTHYLSWDTIFANPSLYPWVTPSSSTPLLRIRTTTEDDFSFTTRRRHSSRSGFVSPPQPVTPMSMNSGTSSPTTKSPRSNNVYSILDTSESNSGGSYNHTDSDIPSIPNSTSGPRRRKKHRQSKSDAKSPRTSLGQLSQLSHDMNGLVDQESTHKSNHEVKQRDEEGESRQRPSTDAEEHSVDTRALYEQTETFMGENSLRTSRTSLETAPPKMLDVLQPDHQRHRRSSTVTSPPSEILSMMDNLHQVSDPINSGEPNQTTAIKPQASKRSNSPNLSLWTYLKDELMASDFDSSQELKRERVTNLLKVPAAIEHLMLFGFFVCLDSLLYMFSIFPIRLIIAFYHFVRVCLHSFASRFSSGERMHLKASQKCDLLKGLLLFVACFVMRSVDASKVYHTIRGQSSIKVYVIFNVLEICDKLCCSLGGDILDALFSKSTLGRSKTASSRRAAAKQSLRPITFFLLALIYMLTHTMVLFVQMITLNVTINFYSNALLSLLISNQFVEIKGSVFKRFERENLFQLSCSDIVERFQQCVFLTIITLRNVIELAESPPSPFSILPSNFVPLLKLPTTTTFESLLTPVFMVLASELMVDWLKHAFITKFNHIRPSVYGKYIDVLCKDLVVGSPGRVGGAKNTFVDQSPVVSRRIGFPTLPLCCLIIYFTLQTFSLIDFTPPIDNFEMPKTSNISPLVTSTQLSGVDALIHAIVHGGIMGALGTIFGFDWRTRWTGNNWSQGALRLAALGIVFAVAFASLVALKVIVGINLLGYSYKRYASIEMREEVENEVAQEMAALEKEEKASVR